MTGLRRLLVGLVVVAVVVFGVDFGLRLWAQSWVGERVAVALHLSKDPDVSFGGALFAPEAIQGSISSATLTSEDFTIRGVPFASGELDLRTVTFSPGKLLLHHEGSIKVRDGDGRLVMTERNLTDAFHTQGVPVTIRLGGGEIHASADALPGEVSATAQIEEGSLVVRPTAFPIRFTLDLPELASGISYRSVSIGEGEGTLQLGIDHARLAVSGSDGG